MLNDKVIGVTGSNGFVGRHLLDRLKKEGFKTVEYTKSNIEIRSQIPNFDGVDYIIHLAAKTFVPDSFKNPKLFFETNVIGTKHVLDGAHKAGIPVVFLSSYVYGNPLYLPIDEKHRTQALNPYMSSKILAEDICKFYRNNYNMKIGILRPFNIFGPTQKENFIIPNILKQTINSNVKSISINNLKPKRDFIYISDVIEAIIKSLLYELNTEINIGSGVSTSVEELIQKILTIANVKKNIICLNEIRESEIMDTKASIEKSFQQINWKPSFTLDLGLQELVRSI